MGDSPTPRKRSWRDPVGPAPKGPGPNQGARPWQQGPAAPTSNGNRPWSKRTKLALASPPLRAVGAGIVIVVLLSRPPRPLRLVLLYAGYEENLAVPHNVAGVKGPSDLRQWAQDHQH